MRYAIDLLENSRNVWTEFWPGSFDEAKEHAREAVKSGCAERAEIRDESGNLRFHFPRVTRRG
jgi:hypothetical protein